MIDTVKKAAAVIRPYLLGARYYSAGEAVQATADAEGAARELDVAGLLVSSRVLADAVEMIKQCTGHPDREEPQVPSHFALIQQARQERDAARAELAPLRAKIEQLRAKIEQLKTKSMDAALERFNAAHDEAEQEHPDFVRSVHESAAWTKLLQSVADRNRPTQALLLNATAHDLRDGTLVLAMPSGMAERFTSRRLGIVRDAMRDVLGGEWQIQLATGNDDTPGGAE